MSILCAKIFYLCILQTLFVVLTFIPTRAYIQFMSTPLLYKHLGITIKNRRQELGLTQDQLARHLDISRASIANMETGRQKILIHHLYRLAEKLDTKVTALLPEPEEIDGQLGLDNLRFSEKLNLGQRQQIARLLQENELTLTPGDSHGQSNLKNEG